MNVNVAIGANALNYIQTGNHNIAIGMGYFQNFYKYKKTDKLFIISSKVENNITTYLIVYLNVGNITSISCIDDLYSDSYSDYYTGPYDNVSQIKHIISYHEKEHPKWLRFYLWMKQHDELVDVFAYMINYYIHLL